MIITKDFVFINFPKTGSTFVRKVLRQVHKDQNPFFYIKNRATNTFKNVHLPETRAYGVPARYMKPTPHGLRSQIPAEHKHKPVISIHRNPFERLVSLFTYKDWVNSSRLSDERKKELGFPDLDFPTFARIVKENNQYPIHPKIDKLPTFGNSTIQFILFFAKTNPFDTLNNFEDAAVQAAFKKELEDVHFIDINHLNDELYDLLIQFNYPPEKVDFIKSAQKMNVSKPKGKKYNQFFDLDTLNYVYEQERFLIDLFPSYQSFYENVKASLHEE